MLAAPHPDTLPGHLAQEAPGRPKHPDPPRGAGWAQSSPGVAMNVLHFARVLRSAGMPVGTDRVQLALQALLQGGLESRADFHAALQACMLSKAEHRVLFNQAFALFWKDPDLEGRMRALLLPRVQLQEKAALKIPENRRLAAALFPHAPQTESPQPPPEELDVQASLTWNEQEVLRQKDFETMTPEEWTEAKRLLRAMPVQFKPVLTRRFERASTGRPDWRSSLQRMGRQGGELWQPLRRRQRRETPPLVVLADISGSMASYSRMLLHFCHALSQADTPVHSFVFGTRLTPISRALRQRDPDQAVAQVAAAVADWSGGTRLADCLHQFNRHWARRVLGGKATVLLITDGLAHGDSDALSHEAERLAKSCRRLLWLNPLLRYEGFEPKAAGAQALLPYVSQLLAAHNLASLSQLGQCLAGGPTRSPHST